MHWRLLDAVSESERAALLGVARLERHRRHRIIFHQGARADGTYLVRSGHVAVKQTLPSGDMAIVVVLGPGDVFGELALVAPAPRSATIVAVTDCEVLKIPLDDLRDLRRGNAGIDDLLIQSLVDEVRRLSDLLLEAHFLPADDRVRRRLDELAGLFAGDGAEPVVIPLTQEELAQVAGTTRATVNRILGAAEAAGRVRVGRGSVEILDVTATPFSASEPGRTPTSPPR